MYTLGELDVSRFRHTMISAISESLIANIEIYVCHFLGFAVEISLKNSSTKTVTELLLLQQILLFSNK